jgi:toxin HigB-1
MIRSFKHRGLKRLYEQGDRSGIRPDLLEIVERILTILDVAPHRRLSISRDIIYIP